MKKKIEYKSYVWANLLRVNFEFVKAQFKSDSYSFSQALEVAYKMSQTKIVEQIKKGFKDEL